ncbi:GNAT family N-acetyltransferase [Mycobacterium sp. MS1601]|uniref:N-acetylglutamate synthase, CG3035 family n=1 Tax=Mycobacterium sp. MS1601 TaxID=1936029 RepID=UPI0009792BF8|nr:GNAT family N-acetyltransferase [Mycobacterium sp. MS1601]AQA02064.1 GNAT family N-acetyltransferase [Mycobacterium sp. MS1601]
MTELPGIGNRVSIRYRVPEGLTDVIGHLDAAFPVVLVRTASDGVVAVDPDTIVSVRELSGRPVRNSEIRALEHAAALAWPGTEHQWIGGWLLRAASGHTSRANSAVPLQMSATLADLPAVVDWYHDRGLPAWLALPERLLKISAAGVKDNRVLVRDIGLSPAASVGFADQPDPDWLRVYERPIPAEVLTAVVDGEVTFASVEGSAVGRGAVTAAPDGVRWLGISSVRVADAQRRRGHARAICQGLMHWGAARGATRCYVQVLADNEAAIGLYESMGFTLHHRVRYVEATSVLG